MSVQQKIQILANDLQARIKTRNAQIRQVEKNIEKGIGFMTENDRKKFLEQEKKRKLLDLKATKQDLWRLRNHEKKLPENKSSTEMQELRMKTEKIAEILRTERERIAEEKRQEQDRKVQKIKKEQERIEHIKKQEKIKSRWEMYRWITKYIDENQEKWGKQEQESQERIRTEQENWDKMNRLEKIQRIKNKQKEKLVQKPDTGGMPSTWQVWMDKSLKNEKENPVPKMETQEQEKTSKASEEQKYFPIFKKLNPTKTSAKNKEIP